MVILLPDTCRFTPRYCRNDMLLVEITIIKISGSCFRPEIHTLACNFMVNINSLRYQVTSNTEYCG